MTVPSEQGEALVLAMIFGGVAIAVSRLRERGQGSPALDRIEEEATAATRAYLDGVFTLSEAIPTFQDLQARLEALVHA